MYFASSVATAVAPGTPGTGNVTTGLPESHDTDVLRTFAAPPSNSVPGFAPRKNVSVVPISAAFGAPCGLAQMRISRSCTAAGIGVAFPFVGPISAPARVFVPAYSPLTTSMFETAWPFARVQAY